MIYFHAFQLLWSKKLNFYFEITGLSMRLTNNLSHGFGHLGVRIKNQVTYTLSTFEQNPTQGILKNGIPNIIRRFKTKFLIIAIRKC